MYSPHNKLCLCHIVVETLAGDRISVGARFSALVQTGPWVYPALCTMGTGSFPGVNQLGRGVENPPHLAPRLRKGKSYTSFRPLCLRGLFQGEIYIYIIVVETLNISR